MLQSLDLSLQYEERPRVDWLQLYRQSLEPVNIGQRLVIVPDGSIATDPERIRIVIPQERAFGTGSHESTSLCLELLEHLDLPGTRCLDAGTGSGILAIAMVKLGARVVFAFDHDFETFGIVRRNAIRNNLRAGSLRQFFGQLSAVRPSPFHVVTMNIIPEVITPLLPSVVSYLRPDSSLILSGITLAHREPLLQAADKVGLEPRRQLERGEWWAGLMALRP